MRLPIIALFIIGLGLSPSLAQVPCNRVETPAKQRVTIKTPGYEPVVILTQVPVPEGTEASADARKAYVTLGIAGLHPIRTDADVNLINVMVCTFTPKPTVRTDKTYLTVRSEVVWEWSKDDHYSLQNGIFLPKRLVASAPAVHSELSDGTMLEGYWERTQYTFNTTQKAKKGKKVKIVTVRKMVATLVLRPI